MPRLHCIRQIFFLACLLTSCKNAIGQEDLRIPSTISYKPGRYGMLCISAQLSSSVTARFVIDTGCNWSLISDTIKKKMRLPSKPYPNNEGKPVFVAGIEMRTTVTPFLQIGALQVPNYAFILYPPRTLEHILRGKEDGVLGDEYLGHFAMHVEPARKQISFWLGGNLTTEELKMMGMEDADALPVSGQAGRYTIMLRLNDEETVPMALDTGSATTNMPSDWVERLHLKHNKERQRASTVFGVTYYKTALLPSMTLGKIIRRNLTVKYSDLNDKRGYPPAIGMDILSHFRFILDIPAKKLYLKPIQDAAKPNKINAKP